VNEEFTKNKQKLESALNNPKFSTDIKKSEEKLRNHIGFEKEKEIAKKYIKLNYISGGRFRPAGKAICYAGPPGVGKTTFVKTLKDAMGRELFIVPCAGLESHREYSILGDGNKPSLVAWAIIKSESKNPIILFDELEKAKNKEVQTDLIKLFEKLKEGEFRDPYFQIEINLRDIAFFVAVNYPQKLSPQLKNLLDIHELEDYSEEDKKKILELKRKKIQELYPDEKEDIIPQEIINNLPKHIQEAGIRQSERVL